MQEPIASRSLKALAVVLAIFVMVPGIDAVLKHVGPQGAQSAAAMSLDSGVITKSPDVFVALDVLEQTALVDERELPESYLSEIGLLPGAYDVRATSDGAVVGYQIDGVASDVLNALETRMELGGWTAVPLGEGRGTTFVKPTGTCTWVLATCTQVGSTVSVVMRSVIS